MTGADADARGLAAVRGLLFGLLAAKAALEGTPDLGRLPDTLFAPVLPLSVLPGALLDAVLSPAGIVALRAAAAILCLAAALGLLRGASLLLVLPPLALNRAVLSSLGYVGHAEAALVAGAVVLAGFQAVGNRHPRRAGAAVLLTLTLGYALTGLHRLAHGVPEVFDPEVLRWWAARNATWDCWENDLPLSCGEAFAASATLPVLAAWTFPTVTLLEIASPLVLLSRRFGIVWLVGIAAFHGLSLVCLSIFFWENVVLGAVLIAWWPGAQRQGGGTQTSSPAPGTSAGPAGADGESPGTSTSNRASR